jgi:ribosome-associated translation inhibitor RaiA
VQKPVQVTFDGLPVDREVEARCVAEAAKLERFFDHITGCRVSISTPSHHHHKGAPYRVQIEMSVPGTQLVVNREPGERVEPGELPIALRDAFDRARRVLEDYARKLRGDVKSHADRPRA